MTQIDDVGMFTNPGDGSPWLDLKFRAIVVGADGVVSKGKLRATLDPSLTGAQTNAVIAAAINTFAVAQGNTLAANQIYLLAFSRI